jgi:hypothetical protein
VPVIASMFRIIPVLAGITTFLNEKERARLSAAADCERLNNAARIL